MNPTPIFIPPPRASIILIPRHFKVLVTLTRLVVDGTIDSMDTKGTDNLANLLPLTNTPALSEGVPIEAYRGPLMPQFLTPSPPPPLAEAPVIAQSGTRHMGWAVLAIVGGLCGIFAFVLLAYSQLPLFIIPGFVSRLLALNHFRNCRSSDWPLNYCRSSDLPLILGLLAFIINSCALVVGLFGSLCVGCTTW